jgi:hypothetical protein
MGRPTGPRESVISPTAPTNKTAKIQLISAKLLILTSWHEACFYYRHLEKTMTTLIQSLVLVATLISSTAAAQELGDEFLLIYGPDGMEHAFEITSHSGASNSTGFAYSFQIDADDDSYNLFVTGLSAGSDDRDFNLKITDEANVPLITMNVWEDTTSGESGYELSQWVEGMNAYSSVYTTEGLDNDLGVYFNDNNIQALGPLGLIMVDPEFVEHLIREVAEDTDDYWYDYANWPDNDLGLTRCLNLQQEIVSNPVYTWYWWSRWECPRITESYNLKPNADTGHVTNDNVLPTKDIKKKSKPAATNTKK